MNLLKFQKTRDCGDATCWYDISFPEGISVHKFIRLVVNEHPTEWGSINFGWDKKLCEYNHGKRKVCQGYREFRDLPVRAATANGGWGLMDYYLMIDIPMPKPEVVLDAQTAFAF